MQEGDDYQHDHNQPTRYYHHSLLHPPHNPHFRNYFVLKSDLLGGAENYPFFPVPKEFKIPFFYPNGDIPLL